MKFGKKRNNGHFVHIGGLGLGKKEKVVPHYTKASRVVRRRPLHREPERERKEAKRVVASRFLV